MIWKLEMQQVNAKPLVNIQFYSFLKIQLAAAAAAAV